MPRPGRPVWRPITSAANPAEPSCAVSTNSIPPLRIASISGSTFPLGMPKPWPMPACFRVATIRSALFMPRTLAEPAMSGKVRAPAETRTRAMADPRIQRRRWWAPTLGPNGCTPTRPAEAIDDATRTVIHLQEKAGIDVVCEGEFVRFDPQPPADQRDDRVFRAPDGGRARADGVRRDRRVRVPGDDGVQDPPGRGRRGADRERHARPRRALPPGEGAGDEAAQIRADRPAYARQDADRSALRRHGWRSPRRFARVLAEQVARLDADVVQIDEANLPGAPEEWEWARAGDEHRSRRGADSSGGPSLFRQLRRAGCRRKTRTGSR